MSWRRARWPKPSSPTLRVNEAYLRVQGLSTESKRSSAGLIIDSRHMPRQIHAVVEQPQYIDDLVTADSEDHKVAPFVSGVTRRPRL